MNPLKLEVLFGAVDKLSPALKMMVGTSKTASQAMKATRDELKRLNDQQERIDGFKKQLAATKESEKALHDMQERIKGLQKQLEIEPSKKINNELKQAVRQAEKLSVSHQKNVQELNDISEVMKKAGLSTKDLAQHQSDLTRHTEQANAKLERQRDQLTRLNAAQQGYQRTQAKLNAIRSTATGSLATAAIGATALSVPIKQYAEAEDSRMTLQISMMDKNGQIAREFREIDNLANLLGTKLPGSTAEFQLMMAKLVQQGVSFKSILGGTGEAAANLAVLLKMPFDAAAEFAAKMQDATGTAERDMLSLMDTIQRTSYLGVDATNMLGGFAKLGQGMRIIKQMGLEGSKAVAPLLVMADQAGMTDLSSAGNAYSKVFKAMMNQGKINDALKGAGASFTLDFTNGKGEFANFDQMFKELAKLKSMNTQKRIALLSDIFGDDAETMQVLNLMIDKGSQGYQETIGKMQRQANLQLRINAQLGTLSNLWDAAKGTFSSLMATAGEALSPQLKALTKGLTDLTENINNWARANPGLASTLMKVVAGGIVLLGVFSALAIVATTILGPFALLRMTLASFSASGGILVNVLRLLISPFRMAGAAVMSLGRAFLVASRFMRANPIIFAIIAIAGAAYLIYRNWEPISAFFSGLWQKVVNGFNTAFALIKSAIQTVDQVFANNPILNLIFPFIGIPRMIIANWQPISAFFIGLWNNISATVSNGVSTVYNWITSRFNAIVATVGGVMATLRGLVASAWAAICNLFINSTPGQYIIRGFEGVIGYLSALKDRFFNLGTNILNGLVDGIRAGFTKLKSVWAEVNSYMPSFTRKTMDIHSPSRVMAWMGRHIVGGLEAGIQTGFPQLKTIYDQVLGVFNGGVSPLEMVRQAMPSLNKVQTSAPRLTSAGQTVIQGDTITIQIQGTAGHAVQDLVAQIEQVLQRRDRDKAARHRASYLDHE